MKILIFSNVPSPYFVEYLNELGKLAEVTAVFDKHSFSHRDKSWTDFQAENFKLFYLSGIAVKKTMVLDASAIRYIMKNRDARIIIANPLTPTGMICIAYCRMRKIPYILQSEGGLPKNGKGFLEKVKTHFLKGAPLYLSGMGKKWEYFSYYGARPERIKQYPFASIHERDLISAPPDENEKKKIRQMLNIPYERMVLYVGRMIQIKGIDVLIQACKSIGNDTGVYFVGGAIPEWLTDADKKYAESENFHFIAHTDFHTLKQFYLAADILVLPTRGDTWGLVINEAMTYGLPVITTKRCVAGVTLIEEGVNGYLVENEAPGAMRERIEYLLGNPDIRKKMGKENILKMKRYTYENMAKTIYEAIGVDSDT